MVKMPRPQPLGLNFVSYLFGVLVGFDDSDDRRPLR
jgi:hypothetical protein